MGLLIDQLRWTADGRPDEVAYVDLVRDEQLTFGAWDRDSNRLARGLVAAGVRPGDRVALHLESEHLLRWLVTYPGIHKAGAVFVPTNTRLSVPELARVLGHAEPVLVLPSPTLVDTVIAAAASVGSLPRVIDVTGPEWDELVAHDDGPLDVPVGEF